MRRSLRRWCIGLADAQANVGCTSMGGCCFFYTVRLCRLFTFPCRDRLGCTTGGGFVLPMSDGQLDMLWYIRNRLHSDLSCAVHIAAVEYCTSPRILPAQL